MPTRVKKTDVTSFEKAQQAAADRQDHRSCAGHKMLASGAGIENKSAIARIVVTVIKRLPNRHGFQNGSSALFR